MFINGSQIAANFGADVCGMFALDGETGDLWFGTQDRLGASPLWYGDAVPGVDAALLNIFTMGTPVSPYAARIALSMFTTGDAWELWSNADICLQPLPPGFNYLVGEAE